MTNRKLEIIKVGFDNENPHIDVILLSLRQREEFDIGLGSSVKVKKGRKKQIALVFKQFRQYAQNPDIVLINKKLSKSLGLKKGDKISLSKEVTESEHQRYLAETNPFNRMFGR